MNEVNFSSGNLGDVDTSTVTKRCMHCGETTVIVIDTDKLIEWRSGTHVQNVWPEMTPDNRELMISGTHPACWEEMWGED